LTRAVLLLLKVLISVGLIWFAFAKIDLGSAWDTLRGISPAAVGLAIVLLTMQMAITALRLRTLLRAHGISYPFAAAFDVIIIGSFFSQTLISFVGGDAMRVWRLVRHGISVGTAAKSVFLDRVAGFGGLFVLLLAATPFLATIIRSPEMLAGQLLIVVLALGGVAGIFVLRRFTACLPQWKWLRPAREVVDTGLQIWRSKQGALLVAGLSVAVHLTNVLILYVIALGLGIELRFIDGLLLFPTVLFISMLPISVSGWGVREGAMIAGLSLVGVPAHQSLALSVCFGLCSAAISLPGGLVWLLTRHKPLPV